MCLPELLHAMAHLDIAAWLADELGSRPSPTYGDPCIDYKVQSIGGKACVCDCCACPRSDGCRGLGPLAEHSCYDTSAPKLMLLSCGAPLEPRLLACNPGYHQHHALMVAGTASAGVLGRVSQGGVQGCSVGCLSQ